MRKTARISSPGQQSVPGIRNRCTILKLAPWAESSFRYANKKSISSTSDLRLLLIYQSNPHSCRIQPFLRSPIHSRETEDAQTVSFRSRFFVNSSDMGSPLARVIARHDEN